MTENQTIPSHKNCTVFVSFFDYVTFLQPQLTDELSKRGSSLQAGTVRKLVLKQAKASWTPEIPFEDVSSHIFR